MSHDPSPGRRDDRVSIVHELQAPITLLRTRLEAALVASWCNPSCRKLLQQCLEEVESMKEIVLDLLLLERADTGQLGAETVVIDLSQLATRVGKRWETTAASRNLEYQVLSAESTPVKGNEAQLSRILFNLIDNAMRFTPRGGTVVVETRRSGSKATLSVKDTGCGISADNLDQVFRPFFQVDQQTSRESGGVGLGLSIVRALAEQNGGSIEVESAPGRGSSFILKLPLAPPDD